MQRAMKYAEDSLIAQNPEWKDKDYRTAWWQAAPMIVRIQLILELERIANEQLATPELLIPLK